MRGWRVQRCAQQPIRPVLIPLVNDTDRFTLPETPGKFMQMKLCAAN
jgi:hypothetical protein